jgi:hypothetical protein
MPGLLANNDADRRRKRMEVLQRLDDMNPVWIELRGLLKEEFDYAVDLALRAEFHAENSAWNKGYASAIRNVLDTIEEYRKAPQQ